MFHDSSRRHVCTPRAARASTRVLRHAADATIEQTLLESLEPRRMFASVAAPAPSVFDVRNIPVYVPANDDLNDFKHGPMGMAGSELAQQYVTYRRAVKAGKPIRMSDLVKSGLSFNDEGMVGVTLRTRGDFNRFAKDLKRNWAFDMTAAIESQSVVQGYMRLNDLRAMATRADVASMTPIYAPTTRVGSASNQGDATLKANTVRSTYHINGSGVKIGVISDSVSRVAGGLSDSVASGDLPNNVQVLRDTNGTDEGRAMLELIHDVAPGAGLGFAAAGGGQAAFANSIDLLRTAGDSDIIVDDIGYADEPFFQPGVIEQAATTFVNAGGTYLAAAGNAGDNGFEQAAKYTTGPDPSAPSNTIQFIDFDPSASASRRMTLVVTAPGDITLEWDDAWNGVSGNAGTDLDIRLYNNGTNTVAYSSLDDNISSGRPVERLRDVAPGTYQVEIAVAADDGASPLPTEYAFVMDQDGEITTTQFAGTRASIFGHASGADVVSVGAVDYFDAPPVSSVLPIPSASFSSVGPSVYTRDASGAKLPAKVIMQKPDISGPDGTNTSFFGDDILEDADTLPNFFGTSAAAPSVAAAVALVKGVNPSLTQAQIVAGLKGTAVPLNGATAGTYNAQAGFGLVDINAAISTLITAPTVDIVDVTPDPHFTAVESITFNFNQPVTGFGRADLKLTRDNGTANLLTNSGSTVRNSGDGKTYTLSGLSGVTGTNGTYTLTLTAAGSGIKNSIGTLLVTNATETWEKQTPPPIPKAPANFLATAIDTTSVKISFTDNNTREAGYTLIRANDINFTSRRKTIQLAANSSSFTDTGLLPATTYYYRIRGYNVTGAGKYTATAIVTTGVGGVVIVDNDSPGARVSGFWGTGTSGAGFLGTDFLQDGNSAKGTKSVRYTPNLAGDGVYFIYARWSRSSKNATNVPFDITYGPKGTLKQTILVDERNRGGGTGWNVIGGPFLMNVGEGAGVRIRNTATNGTVIADAIQFLPGAPLDFPSGGTTARTSAYHPPAYHSPTNGIDRSPFNSGNSINPNGDDFNDDKDGDGKDGDGLSGLL